MAQTEAGHVVRTTPSWSVDGPCQGTGRRPSTDDTDGTMDERVIIVGAGPVGLVAGCLLSMQGSRSHIVEAAADLPRDLRASTFHPPTLDMLERFGVVESMIAQGLVCPTWQFRDRREGVVANFELRASRMRPSIPTACSASNGGSARCFSPACRRMIARRSCSTRGQRRTAGFLRSGDRYCLFRRQHELFAWRFCDRCGWHRKPRPQGHRRDVRRADDPRDLPDAVHHLRFPRGDARHRQHSRICPIRPSGLS